MVTEGTYLEALSVQEFNEYLQFSLENDPQLRQVWIIGEVSSLHDHPSGVFLTLSDPENPATLQCVIWRSQLGKLTQFPQKGEKVLVLGSIRLYGKRGEYKLNLYQCLAIGEGIQSLQSQQLRWRLQNEGLFDLSRKRPIPAFPAKIAVVTSPNAAAWGDICRTLSQRYPNLTLLLSPAVVQGEKAPSSIASAIQRVNKDGRANILLLARGGGSVEDLACFNDEKVVRAIAESEIPVVTGIGHERDESLADLVADIAFHTPTAAAEKIVPDYTQLVADYYQYRHQLDKALQDRLKFEKERLSSLKDRLKRQPEMSRTLIQATHRCQLLQEKLLSLDPEAVLKRGYAVIKQADGVILNSTDLINPDQELIIEFGQDKIKVKVLEISDFS